MTAAALTAAGGSPRRRLTYKEELMVDLIVAELWECKQLGDAQIARAAKMDWSAGRERKRTLNRIYFLMPDIVCEVARLHPGFAAVRARSGLVEITDDADRGVRAAVPRFHQVHTKIDRICAELGPAARTGTQNQKVFAKWADGLGAWVELGPMLAAAALEEADQS